MQGLARWMQGSERLIQGSALNVVPRSKKFYEPLAAPAGAQGCKSTKRYRQYITALKALYFKKNLSQCSKHKLLYC